jgi:hypothetical protein
MPRCAPDRRTFVLSAALALLGAAVQGQPVSGHRRFPANALRGELVITGAPEVTLNGRPDRLAPGARIRGESNLLTTPASLTGQRLTVHYTREASSGLLMDVWILQPMERSNRPWPVNEREAQTWIFDPAGQTWKKP